MSRLLRVRMPRIKPINRFYPDSCPHVLICGHVACMQRNSLSHKEDRREGSFEGRSASPDSGNRPDSQGRESSPHSRMAGLAAGGAVPAPPAHQPPPVTGRSRQLSISQSGGRGGREQELIVEARKRSISCGGNAPGTPPNRGGASAADAAGGASTPSISVSFAAGQVSSDRMNLTPVEVGKLDHVHQIPWSHLPFVVN